MQICPTVSAAASLLLLPLQNQLVDRYFFKISFLFALL